TALPRASNDCRVAFDQTGHWLAVLDGEEVRLVEVRRSTVQSAAALQVRPVQAACWTGSGLACVIGDRTSGPGEVSLWDGGRAPRMRGPIRLPESRLPARIASAKGRVAWVDDGAVKLRRIDRPSDVRSLQTGEVQGMAYDGDRLWLAGQSKVRRFDGLKAGP